MKSFCIERKMKNFIADIQIITGSVNFFFEKWGYLLAWPGIYT